MFNDAISSVGLPAIVCSVMPSVLWAYLLFQALGEMNKQAENSSQSNYATTMAVGQLRAVLAARERARGRPYLEADPAGSSQSMAALVLTLEKCLQESDHETESLKQKVSQVSQWAVCTETCTCKCYQF